MMNDSPGEVPWEPAGDRRRTLVFALLTLFGIALFIAVAVYDFLLFHVLSESLSICVATGAFFVAWHTRRMAADAFLPFLGLALICVAGLDFAHTLTYKGMTVLATGDPNVPTQIWLAGRFVLGASMLAAPLFLGRGANPSLLAAGFIALAALLLASVALGVFPGCWVEGQGLTAFKIAGEYVVCAMLALAGLLFHLKRKLLDRRFLHFMYFALAVFILSEFSFTFYNDVYGVTNTLGHLLKILAFLALYRGIIELGLSRPLTFLFRDLKGREEQLARSEEMLKEAQAIASMGNFQHDVENDTWLWSEQTFKLLGLDPAKDAPSLGLFLERVQPEYRRAVERNLREILAGERPFDFECRVHSRNDEVRSMRILGTVQRDQDRKPLNMHGTLQDISERKRNEADLEKRRRVDASLADLAGRILSSHSLDDISSMALGEALKLTHSPVGFTGYLDQRTGRLMSPTMTRQVWADCRVKDKAMAEDHNKGLWGWCLDNKQAILSNSPALDARSMGTPPGHVQVRRFLAAPAMLGGSVLGQIAVANASTNYTAQDLSVLERIARLFALGVDRLRHEGELRKLSRALEQSPVAIVITDNNGIVEYVNPAYRKITGFEPEEILGRYLEFLGLQQNASLREAMWQEVFQGRTWSGDLRSRTKEGREFWETVSIAPVLNDQGEVIHCIALKQDITERVEFEKLKEDVERILLHDLRAPLNAILGMPQLLLMDETLSEENREYVAGIQNAGYRMLDMINLSLELYRMETGTYEFKPEGVDLLKVLRRLLTDLQATMGECGVTVALRLNGEQAGSGDEFVAQGEEHLCYSLLANLLRNAMEASPCGASVTVDLSGRNPRRVEIRNQGEVPGEIRDRFFEKYATFGKKMGTGLGTYSAKLMTETQGGTISMTTSPDTGTRIAVTLPAWD